MQVCVRVLGHVKVDHNVDALNVDAAAKKLRRDQNAVLEVLEGIEALEAFFLAQTRVDVDGREALLREVLRQGAAALGALDKDHHLVELQGVQQIRKLPELGILPQANKVLLQAVERKLRVIVDEDFRGLNKTS